MMIIFLGVFIAPSKQEGGNVFHLQRLLFDNFRSAVELIHGLFELSTNQRTSMASTTSENGNAKWTSRSLLAIKEHVSAPLILFFLVSSARSKRGFISEGTFALWFQLAYSLN